MIRLTIITRNKIKKWSLYAFLIPFLTYVQTAKAQFGLSKAKQDSIWRITQTDYKNMLQQLGIASIRPGPSGNPNDANAANTDETKVDSEMKLPDPLRLTNGKKVADAKTWWKRRRPEIVEYYDKEVYGRVPKMTPKVRWEIISIKDTSYGTIKAVEKSLLGHVDNSIYPDIEVNIQLTLTLPKVHEKLVPVITEFGFVFPKGFKVPENMQPKGKAWQEQLLEQGWGFAVLVPTSYQADNGAGLSQGIIGLCNKGAFRKSDDWGALRAWAWGASRAIDYYETDKEVDAKKLCIEGLSRYGKAALVAMAYEPRFSMGFIGSSGNGGTKIMRRQFGEQIENLASSGGYHWFAGNFIKYAGPLGANDLPVDAHELVALCAPRPVFIGSGSPQVEGQWVDAKGMFLGGAYAAPVYELLGKKGYGTMEMPPQETGLLSGEIAFRQHAGGHTNGPNWPYFIQWARRYFDE
ncbi:glucuronyl esterase domain-containing protein [Pedobacter sp. MW01-1-1]|uniref:glucuronyl esterase domain-containing protein n=1 Tax=Pedobacter sp. MW01-1-1 TaxID=3383027 RepID=UPI003FF12CD7